MTAICTAQEINIKPRTKDVLIEENLEFRGLLLSPRIQEGLTKSGFVRPSPIQLKAIPLGRCGLDLIVQAKSGTGKTCVFSVIALEGILLDSLATQVLVLAPTREIAVQICEVVNNIGSCMSDLKCLTFIGGTPLSEDRLKLARCHIAVGTPGRIKQLIEEKLLKTSNIRLFVLDEADKLLEDSFQEQVNWIFSSLPENKQMLALSATYPEILAQHLTAYMRNPTFLRLNITDPALLGIRQYYRSVKFNPLANKLFDKKTDALLELLSSVEFHQCLVFSNYQMRAESLSDVLNFRGWPATYISGSQEQQDRMAAMTSLKQMTCRVLISTDLTSRGIDAENVNLVINLDLPPNHETYLHRIGRAGRFGTYGAGVSFVAEGSEMDEMRRIEKHCKTTIKPLPDPIPGDLAHSSGFISLDHLVTTEMIITKKEVVDSPQNKPVVASSTEPRSEAEVPNGDDPAKSSDSKGNDHPNLDPNGDGPSISDSNGDGPSISDSNGDGPSISDSNGDGPSISDSNVDGPSKSNSDSVLEVSEPTDSVSITCKNLAVPGPQNPPTPYPQNFPMPGPDSGSWDLPTVPTPQKSASPQGKPQRKVNNVWTALSYNYGTECKDMEDKRAMGKLVMASAQDQHRNECPRPAGYASTCAADKENSQNVANVAAGSADMPKNGTDTTNLGMGNNVDKSGTRTGVPMVALPCLHSSRQCPAKLPTYLELLADYEKYMLGDECEPVNATLVAADVETRADTKYGSYLKSVAELLQDLVQSEKLQAAQVETIPENHTSPKCTAESSKSMKPLDEVLKLSSTEKTEYVQLNDLKLANEPDKESYGERDGKESSIDSVGGKQLTMVQMLENYAALEDNHRCCTQSNSEEKSDRVSSSLRLSQFAKSTKPKGARMKKRMDPYGPWVPYIPPEPAVKLDEEDEEDSDEAESEGGESGEESDWESSSLNDVGAVQEDGASRHRHQSPARGTSGCGSYPHTSHRTRPGEHEQFPPYYEQHGYYPQHGDEQWSYPQQAEELRFFPPHLGSGDGYYQTPSGHGCYPPPSGYVQYPSPQEVPWSPDLAFHNMMQAQQAMLFTTMCYQQYVMHLQQAEFYKQMLQTQHAHGKTGSLYREQERYIRKMAKWMAKNNQN